MKNLKNTFLIFAFVCLFFFIVYIFSGPFFKISIIDIKADKGLKKSHFYRAREKQILSHLKSYKGQSLWQVDLKELSDKLDAFYMGAEVYVFRKFPNRLVILLKKKKAALLLLKEPETFYLLFHGGEIGEKNTEALPDLPILRGQLFWDQPPLRKRALDIVSSIPKNNNHLFSVQNISEILYNKTNDSFLFYTISGHFILELKKPVESKKTQNIDFVLNYLNQRGNKGARIDARFDKKIIVKNPN